MNKNVKSIFLVLALFTLLVAVTAVSATDDVDDTNVITDTSSDVASDVVSEQTTSVSDNNIANTENYEENNIEETTICTGRTYNNPISITPTNYATEMSNIYNYDAVEFSGTFSSTITGGSISITSPIVFTSTSTATFEDTQFVINSDDVTIKNLIIENDDGTSGAAISSTGYDNIEVINNSISVTKTTAGETVGIKFNSTHNQTICGNNITMDVYPQYRWEVIPSTPYDIWIFHLYNSAIVVDDSYEVYIKNNKVITSDAVPTEYYGTNEGMNIRNSHDIDVSYNNVTVTGGDFTYGISFEQVTTSNATNNKIEVNSENYADGIQMIEVKHSQVAYNKIDVSSRNTTENPASGEAFGYGIYMSTNWGSSQTYNNTIEYNNITIDSTVGYAIEGYIIDENRIRFNKIIATGNVTMGIGLYNSSNNNITNNNITVTAKTRTLSSSIYEQIPPQTTGIKIVGNETSTGNLIDSNKISVTDTDYYFTSPYAITLEDTGNTVTNNDLYSKGSWLSLSRTGNGAVSGTTGNTVNGNYH